MASAPNAKPLWRSLLDRFSTRPPASPLAHLSDVSPEGLKVRASLWSINHYEDPEDHVKNALLCAAYDMEEIEKAFSRLKEIGPADLKDFPVTLDFVFDGLPQSVPAQLAETAAMLRVNQYPDDSGSTATHLEAAAERISHYAQCMNEIAGLSGEGLTVSAVRAIAAEALHGAQPDVAYEAPALRH